MKNVERRNLVQEFRVDDSDGSPKIAGYAAVFDSPSNDIGWTEEIDPHAFDNVLAQNPDVIAAFNHDPDYILGRTTSGTLSLSIDSRGLAYEIDPPDTQLARDLIVSMKRKDIRSSSFAFITKRDQWTDNQDGTVSRRILEIGELIDVSPVTWPAYNAATSQVRSLPDSMPVEMRSRFEQKTEEVKPEPAKPEQRDNECVCGCEQCSANACGICSADPQCVGAVRQMRMKLQLLSLK